MKSGCTDAGGACAGEKTCLSGWAGLGCRRVDDERDKRAGVKCGDCDAGERRFLGGRVHSLGRSAWAVHCGGADCDLSLVSRGRRRGHAARGSKPLAGRRALRVARRQTRPWRVLAGARDVRFRFGSTGWHGRVDDKQFIRWCW